MKSRILCFDKTVFRKDITRFAPAWVLYTICLLMGMLLMAEGGSSYSFQQNLSYLLPVMSSINLCYALLVAQLLFGDLYSARMCNAIHALPVRREGLFLSHTAAGLAYSAVPTLLGALLALVLGIGTLVQGGWAVSLWWLLGTNLQYLFFYGVAAFSALCVGNRFAQAVVYGILNFASILAYWLVDTLYTPLLYGLKTPQDGFLMASPVCWFTELDYMEIVREYASGDVKTYWLQLGDGWGYLAICALVGAALLACACMLYRRRNLECAGDFMAVKVLEPVFLTVYSLVIGTVFYFFVEEIMYMGSISFVYLVIGLAVGFFTGEMLLKRTIRIFKKKTFLKFAALAVGFGLTLGVTGLDPFGVTKWMPQQEEVASVEIWCSHYSRYNYVTLDQPEEIEDVLRVHEITLQDKSWDQYDYSYTVRPTEIMDGNYYNLQTISLHYTLTDGSIVSRYYEVYVGGEAGKLLIPYFSSLEGLFQDYKGEYTPQAIADATYLVRINDGYGKELAISDPDDIESLLEAIEADCEAGIMSQNYNFRPNPDVGTTCWINFEMKVYNTSGIDVYTDCDNTNAWLMEHGYTNQVMEDMVKQFGGAATEFTTAEIAE